MSRPTYTFTRPTDGKAFPWKPLTVGDEMDIQASYRREEAQHLTQYALFAARLGLPGPNDLREWETVDLLALINHVSETEAGRAAALTKPSGSAADTLDALLKDAIDKHGAFVAAARDLIAAARVANVGPLGQPRT